ncbi:MAG: CBS domain-containing protein [Dehalococcoidia bacterium]
MIVSAILKQKGADVETTHPEVSVAEAARRLTEKGIGSLVVCDTQGKVVGILSERDIIKGIPTHGQAVFGLPIKSIMTARIVACAPNDQVKQIMSIMTSQRVRHVPVMADHRLLGIISIGDVVKSRLGQTELELNVLRDHARMHSSAWPRY